MAVPAHTTFHGLHRHLLMPTGIEHAIYCHFFSSAEQNLVAAGTSQLHVYRLNFDVEPSAGKTSEKTDSKSKKAKLECVASYSLFGNVMSLQKVRLAGSIRDAILISFQDGKLSVVEFDPGTHDLKTSSLHYFEQEELKDGFKYQSCNIPIVRVDPDNRCATMLIYGSRIVVLPFRRDGSAEEQDIASGNIGKAPIMSSYIIDARKLDEPIINIIDMQFLHGYFEPTLLILYEPLPTWAGRVVVRKDSCSIVALSLNIQQRVHPIIWSVSGLPFDCTQALAVPKPIGGILVLAVNSLLYLTQSVPPYGVSLNSIAEASSDFPLKQQDGVKISLDCAQAALIGQDKLVLSLKAGELYVLTLIVDGMRCVRSFNFDKAAASVLTTCMCLCDEGYLFLGSRLGNSLLLKFTKKVPELLDIKTEDTIKKEKVSEPPNKKKRLDTLGEWIASAASEIDDIDELEVYGSEAQMGTQITAYTFEVCDSLMNIGPCGQMVMGEPAFLSEEFTSKSEPDLELVTTSGYSKNGALSVLQRSIRPQVVTTFELPGCCDMWTVMSAGSTAESTSETESSTAEVLEGSHAFLIMSREDSSMVLQTGQEIMELDHSGFSTQSPTVFAGNIGNNQYIMQVSPNGVRLLQGVKQLQHIPMDIGSPIIQCSIADPYAMLLGEEGQLIMLVLKTDGADGEPRLNVIKPSLTQTSKVLAVCAYRDISGMFTTVTQEETVVPAEFETPAATASSFSFDNTVIDDEDELLYGESDTSFLSPTKQESEAKKSKSVHVKNVQPTFWVVLSRQNGVLEIYTLPDFNLSFRVKNFPIAHRVLVDSGCDTAGSSNSATNQDKPTEIPLVQELLLVGFGNKKSKPHLLAWVDDDLLIYEAFAYHVANAQTDNQLKLRFKKSPHGLTLRARRTPKSRKSNGTEGSGHRSSTRLRPFDDVSGYGGVFICGAHPHWVFVTVRGVLRIHPMWIDGPITCFAPFHNVNCPKGFLYFNKQGELRISVLPTHLSYDAPWPVRKVPLRCTPHFIAYHPESKTYAVCTSASEICNRVCLLKGEGDKEFEVQERDDRFIYPTIEKFSIQLFSPVSWEPVPYTRVMMDDFEHVTSLRHVNLTSEGTVSGMKGYIVVAANQCNGEDITSRGRLLIFDVTEVVPEPGQPITKNKLKTLYDKEQKGPVTALECVEGFLVTAVGQKIYIWRMTNNDLEGVAFIDTQIYIHHLCTIKNFLMVADIFKSISILRYQCDMKVLSMVSRDIKPLEVYSTEYLVDDKQLCFLVSDRDKNLIVYAYDPQARESHGGQRLLRKADVNIGSHINTFFRIRCKLSDPASLDKKTRDSIERRHTTYFATLDGGIGYVLPTPEKVYRRLLMLQNLLQTQIPHIAGLNPRSFRAVKMEMPSLSIAHKNILDGELIWKYLHLSLMEKKEMVKKIGTTHEQLMDDLLEIDRMTEHF